MSSLYFALIFLVLFLGLGSQMMIKRAYKKWKKNQIGFGVSGADAARTMLNTGGLNHVTIIEVGGELSDHFDPRTNTVALSGDVYHGRTVSAIAIACHESGHALQHARGYVPAKVRGAIVPVASIASNLWVFVLIAGIVLSLFELIYVAIALFAAVLIFQLVTLPVEFDASKRARDFIQQSGWLNQKEYGGAKAVLRSAAFTYVAAALASILQLLYLLSAARR
ncbi:MAG: zinc metallopeptidase [Coriobacteriia bacterium]|nr:zinc metallopeptidase [Coriobacteriia bacterium]